MVLTTFSDENFERLSKLIQGTWGIKMPPAKRSMIQARLARRLRALGLGSLDEYCDFVFCEEGNEEELVHLIDAISTNKTDFFREPDSIEKLVQQAVPELIRERGAGVRKPVHLWSAGCATGEEPYTLAMVLLEFAGRHPGLEMDFLVLGTDVSAAALETARKAVYPHTRVEPVPMEFRKKYLLRSKRPEADLVRMAPEVRDKVRFRQINLMEDFGLREEMDVIFCRNVIIYFDKPTQEAVMRRLCDQLAPGGFLFIGHSETLNGMKLPVTGVVPTVYRKTG
ncbi:MAG: CheR family methyltransferase [Desulfatibacillaceae bacterium]